MNDFIFNELKAYDSEWKTLSERPFTEKELSAIETNYVRSGDYGKCVCFVMKSSQKFYIQLEPNAPVNINDTVNLKEAKLKQLEYVGSDPDVTVKKITRVSVPLKTSVDDFENPFGLQ